MLKIMRFMRILRLLRVLKLKKVIYKLEEYIVTDTLTFFKDSIQLLATVLYLSHWMACIFYFVGDFESTTDPTNWINNSGIYLDTTMEQYYSSLYWAFTTMTTVGYGDITPNTDNEKVFVMICMLIACGFFAYTVGSIGSILNRSNMMASEFKEKILHIN